MIAYRFKTQGITGTLPKIEKEIATKKKNQLKKKKNKNKITHFNKKKKQKKKWSNAKKNTGRHGRQGSTKKKKKKKVLGMAIHNIAIKKPLSRIPTIGPQHDSGVL